jgi:tetratricopeptide (TPR) repeat protein
MPIKRAWLFVALLLIALIALYGQFLWNPIVFDDLYFFIIDDAGNQPVSGYHFSLLELRSLPYATLAWSKVWFGLELINFRVGNLLLHAAVALALFFFLAELFAAVCGDCGKAGLGDRAETCLSSQYAAFFAALLFALHPVAVYAAGYLVQRTIVMATLFGLLAMLVYVHGSVRQQPLWLWSSVPLYYLAVFSKEHAIMLPAVLLALTILLHDDWRTKFKQRRAIFAALAGIAVLVLVIKKGLLGSVYEINAPEMLLDVDSKLAYPLSVLTQSWLFFKYAGLWLLPNPAWMSVDMREPFAQSLLSVYLLAFMSFALWGVGAFLLLLKRGWLGLMGFALLFPWLMFFTEFSAVRIQESFVLYRSYLWMIVLCSVVPLLFMRVRQKLAVASLGLLCALMVPLAWDRLTTFSHPLLLWDDAAKLVEGRPYLPGMERIYHNRGLTLSKTRLKQEAIADYSTAIRMKPNYSYAYNDRGAMYLELQQYAEALKDFDTAIALNPLYPNAYQGRGMVYEALGNQAQSLENYKKSCELGRRGCNKLAGPIPIEYKPH